MNDKNPLDTMVTHALGRSTGDTAFRDLIGDTSEGPMGTHIGNHQGITSNVQSEYNRVSMTEAQLNMSIIDATRGYGQGSGHDAAESVFSQVQNSSMHHMDTAFEMGMNGPSSSLYDPHSQTAAYDNSSLYNTSPYPTNSQIPTDSVHNIGVQNMAPNPIGNLASKPNSRVNPDLVKDLQNNSVAPAAVVVSTASTKFQDNNDEQQSANNISEATETPQQKEKKETLAPSEQKSTGSGVLRPTELPNFTKTFNKREENQSSKAVLQTKLSKMTEDELITLIEKSTKSLESEKDSKRIIIENSKLSILKQEVKRRLS